MLWSLVLVVPGHATSLTYNFDDGSLQGWIIVASDPGNSPDPQNYASVSARDGITPQGGSKFVMCDPSANRDSAHKPLWIRSPHFVIDQAGTLTLYLAGGTSKGGYPGNSGSLPTNASQIPTGVDSGVNGLMGVALRDTATGEFVLTAERPGPSDASWKQIVWDVSAYRGNGRTYSVELFDYHSGNGWSHLSLDTVSIPGTAVPMPTTTISGKVTASFIGIPDVVVTTYPGNLEGTTDANGDYTITGASSGVIYSLSASNLPAGKLLDTAPASFTALAEPNTGKDFTLKDTTTISGRVTAAGAGVPFVVVSAAPGGLTATTDADGDYTITGASSGVTYSLSASYLPAGKLLDTAPASFTALAEPNTGKDFTLKDTTTISGRVTTAGAGVRFVVVRAAPGGLTATTNADGDYTITGASSGVTYTLSVTNLPPGKVVATTPAAFVASQQPNPGKDFTLGDAAPPASPNDTDADGLPDSYEIAAVGNTISLTATGDFDGDGTGDVAEYHLGLIPNNPESMFKLTIARDPATGNVVLTWPSKQGAQFDVQWSETMAPGTWATIDTVSAQAGSTSTFTDFGGNILDYSKGVYRVCLTSGEGYVYSSFTGDGEDGLHLLTSADGKTWKTVKNHASLYQQSEGLMRDPSICRGGDGVYHLVWTTGWWNDTIGIAHSYDLINWTPMQTLHIWADYAGPGSEESDGTNWPADLSQPAPRNPKVRNCWAPEIFHDDQTGEYVIFWATTIDDASVFPLTWDANRWERMNQRVYYVTTKDFNAYSPRKFFYAKPDRVVIDACICKVARGQYRMVIKDELTQRLHVAASTKPLTTWAEMPGDFWGPMSNPAFTGPGVPPDNTNAEGPSVLRVGNEWFVYCDYWATGRNGLFSTNDFVTMNRINEQFVAPLWVRHGSAFKVPKADFERLEALK